jgi:hypothetical protein
LVAHNYQASQYALSVRAGGANHPLCTLFQLSVQEQPPIPPSKVLRDPSVTMITSTEILQHALVRLESHETAPTAYSRLLIIQALEKSPVTPHDQVFDSIAIHLVHNQPSANHSTNSIVFLGRQRSHQAKCSHQLCDLYHVHRSIILLESHQIVSE